MRDMAERLFEDERKFGGDPTGSGAVAVAATAAGAAIVVSWVRRR